MKLLLRLTILIALLSAALHSRAQVNTDQVLRIGQNALYFDDYMLSIQYFNQAIQAKPHLAQPYFLRAIAKLNLDDFIGAETDASTALGLNPYLTDAWEVRGVARQNQGKNRLAVEDYTEALKLLPRNRQILFNKALALNDLKDFDAAAEAFDELIRYYPGFGNAYLGRARMMLEKADTTAARADIDKAIKLNPNTLNAYIMRADIAIHSNADFESALADIDKAIKLQPRMAGLYINRAFLRYRLDSYSGAMADYDYALTLEPLNAVALFNRGLLLAEVNANDLALEDFNRVLELDPDDYRALYNRAVIHKAKGNYDLAAADAGRVASRFPDFPGALYLRGAIYRDQGKLVKAEADFKAADRLSKALTPEIAAKYDDIAAQEYSSTAEGSDMSDSSDKSDRSDRPEKSGTAARRFARLLTVDDNADFREEYNNSAIRGRVQDRNFKIETEPLMMLSFYSSPSELRRNTYYIREVDDLNATRMLRFALVVTNVVPTLDESTANRHFQSIDYYTSYLASHKGRPVDYIGRALDFLTVRDYLNAERDADRAIALAPDLAIAYMIRAQARYGKYQLEQSNPQSAGQGRDKAIIRAGLDRKALNDVLNDYTKVIELSPMMAVAWFNKGTVQLALEDFSGASDSFSKAIEIKPDFGEAYYNRGYIALRAGRRNAGVDDLSKAGELGIVPAYNLIKRMSR
ncbi:MAG: tetratricopeptide repeat protein [Muribaculaceae bacterium]|nr:tetratricopeptide repeat protein [Muribaculaceae bacterium]